ncbi:hypothetical protein [Endozoicomonas numazuensis]|uniref:Uncharacterized protein n=1 Tax=Endozoicomonas numazuensis TaxID=1137799 RepID=A0A081NEN2_9GAMM|nr:hypothetical protein [Endozoicomonas numazuensis]KEQ16905.1 hypothetical protein GZ78_19855 [Endozoicomonas numazuensis]
MYKYSIIAGGCWLLMVLLNPAQAHECRELEPHEYQQTMYQHIYQGMKGISEELMERYAKYTSGPLSTEKFSAAELKLLNLMGLTYITHYEQPAGAEKEKSYFSLGDTLENAIYKLSGEGDESDEVTGLLEDLLACYEQFDGFNLLPRISPLIYLNTFRIQGDRIFDFYRDLCDRNQLCVLEVLYLVNLGMISSEELNRQIDKGKMSVSVKSHFGQAKKAVKKIVIGVQGGKIAPIGARALME